MNKRPCIGFYMEDAFEAYQHMGTEVIEEYGDRVGHNWLHTWDEGGRKLLRCRKCGGYILCQFSELHSMEDEDYYSDSFQVSGPEEARNLNRMYDGYKIETDFPGRWLICDPCKAPLWSDRLKKAGRHIDPENNGSA